MLFNLKCNSTNSIGFNDICVEYCTISTAHRQKCNVGVRPRLVPLKKTNEWFHCCDEIILHFGPLMTHVPWARHKCIKNTTSLRKRISPINKNNNPKTLSLITPLPHLGPEVMGFIQYNHGLQKMCVSIINRHPWSIALSGFVKASISSPEEWRCSCSSYQAL